MLNEQVGTHQEESMYELLHCDLASELCVFLISAVLHLGITCKWKASYLETGLQV